MLYDHVRAALAREPFLPFDLHTQAGRTYPVVHPENVGAAPKLDVLLLRHDGHRTAMIALDAITEITYPATITDAEPRG